MFKIGTESEFPTDLFRFPCVWPLQLTVHPSLDINAEDSGLGRRRTQAAVITAFRGVTHMQLMTEEEIAMIRFT